MTMYAKYFFGFSPEEAPIITFAREGDRDALLRLRRPGEVILYVGTQGDETVEEDRGRLLGAAEIGDKSVRSADIVDLTTAPAFHFENGRYRWPEAIPMLRAWRFDPAPFARDVLSASLRADAQVRAVPLPGDDEAAIRALKWNPVMLAETPELQRQRWRSDVLAGRSRPGPIAGPGTHTVNRGQTPGGYTYAARFGDTAVWKIGCAIDVHKRLKVLNAHVPFELFGKRWVLDETCWTQQFGTLHEALDMEQRVLKKLEKFSTHGERVRCSKQELDAAWMASLSGY